MQQEKEDKITLDNIRLRRSIRNYLDAPIEWDKVASILECGRFAPSSGNIQNFRFIVVANKESRVSIANACMQQDWMATAPIHIVVCADLTLAKQYYGIRGERLYSIQNCAAAVQNILISAQALGLGTCWVGAFDEETITGILKIPDYARPQAIITMGYPAEKVAVPPSYTMEHMVFLEGWGGRVRDGAILGGYYHLASRGKQYVDMAVDKFGQLKDKFSKKKE